MGGPPRRKTTKGDPGIPRLVFVACRESFADAACVRSISKGLKIFSSTKVVQCCPLTLSISFPAILYMIFQHSVGRITVPEHLKEVPEQAEPKHEESKETPVTGTFLEKTLSSVMINVLKSDEGRMFMESVFNL